MSTKERVQISITTGTIIRTILVLVGVAVLWMISDILLWFFTALLLAGVMYPFVRWAVEHRIPKGVAVAVFYFLLFGLMAATFSLIIPALVDQVSLLSKTSHTYTDWLMGAFNWAKGISAQFGLSSNLKSGLSTLPDQIQGAFGSVVNILGDVFGSIAAFVVILVLAAYMITQDRAAKSLFKNYVPAEYQEFASQLVWQVIDRLGGWLRGQMFLSFLIGLLYFIGFIVVGIPYALLLAVLGGLFEFIPYFGPILSAIPAVLIAFTVSPTRGIIALVLIFVIQELEGHFIVPKVMQRAVGLNPIASIIALLVGAKLFGFIGAVFAIPLATALSVVWVEFYKFRRSRA